MSEIRHKSTRHAYFLRSAHGTGHIRCAYCGCELDHHTATLDHYVPQEKDGSNETTNIVVACSRCNRAKSDRPAAEYIAEEAWRQALAIAWAEVLEIAPAGADPDEVDAVWIARARCIVDGVEAAIRRRVRNERRRRLDRAAGRREARYWYLMEHEDMSQRRWRTWRPEAA